MSHSSLIGDMDRLRSQSKIFGHLSPVTFVIAAKRVYVFTHPNDIAAVFRNTTALDTNKPVAAFIVRRCEYPNDPAAVERIENLVRNKQQFFRLRMSPAKANGIVRRMIPQINHRMEELRKGKSSELDFFRWMCDTVCGGLAEAVWGPRLLNESPDFVEAMRNLDESFLKLSYGVPTG
ncbi:hypothetical protein FPQ18DRAFT_305620 [Pyronema domesticum]|nr:hypothetical protein FPQ18DRAFT_305620 [Pyronema domesticum]